MLTIILVALVAFVAGAVVLIAALFALDLRIRARHGLRTEADVIGALAAYEDRDTDADLTVWQFVAKLEGKVNA
jgi:capsular polysaccharide biosynthesis protein